MVQIQIIPKLIEENGQHIHRQLFVQIHLLPYFSITVADKGDVLVHLPTVLVWEEEENVKDWKSNFIFK